MSSGAVSYGSSPRKTLDLGSKVQAKEYVNQCLDDMPIKTWDGLWPLFRSGPAAHPVPWVAGEWNNEENFEQAATELLRKNGIIDKDPVRYRKVNAYMDGNTTIKLDAGLFFTDAPSMKSWRHVAVICECKLQQKADQQKAQQQLKRAAELVFAFQPRLFLWGLSVYSEDVSHQKRYIFRLYLFTRSGIICSKKYNLENEFCQFCDLLVGFARLTPEEHGWYLLHYGSTFQFPSSVVPNGGILNIPSFQETLTLRITLAVKRGIQGRATLVLGCTNEKNEPRVVKLTWLSMGRAERYRRSLKLVTEKVKNSPRVLFSEILSRNGADCTVHQILRERGRDDAFTEWLEGQEFPNSYLFCDIGDRVGKTLWEEMSLENVFRTFREVVTQVKDMEEGKMYHRDISIGNIFSGISRILGDEREGPPWVGDVDCMYADEFASISGNSGQALSGTMPYMSEAVLLSLRTGVTYKQTGIDDLESVVWVLLWFFYHTDPRGPDAGWDKLVFETDMAFRCSENVELNSSAASRVSDTSQSHGVPDPFNQRRLKKQSASIPISRVESNRNVSRPDPLNDFVFSLDSARGAKQRLKNLGPLPGDAFEGWDFRAVKSLWTKIWDLKGWKRLMPSWVNPRDEIAPLTEDEGKAQFLQLVKGLEEIFEYAALHVDAYYQHH